MSEIKDGHKSPNGKWVFKIKYDINHDITRFKVYWVVYGYLQQFLVNFDQTYATVVKPMAFRVLFAIVAYYNLDIDQLDIKTAFLYGLIDQLVYVQVLKSSKTQATKGLVCKLLKALYNLKQTPRIWYKSLSIFLLEKLRLQQINADHSIFIFSIRINKLIVSTFIDNIKIIEIKDSSIIIRIK